MSISFLLLGILPLLLFVILDTFFDLKIAIIGALVLGFVEMGYSIAVLGGIDWVSIFVFALLVGMGLVAIKMNNPIYFKFQPVVCSLVFGLMMLISYLIDKPIFALVAEKYEPLLLKMDGYQMLFEALGPRGMMNYLSAITLGSSIAFLLHAAMVAYAAKYMSKWWWIIAKGIGIWVVLVLVIFIQLRLFPISI